jgi:lipopolysaccharide/colanic/teichoic acid biosynthesis glycosyltransferase
MEESLDSIQIIETISESRSIFQRFFKRLMDIVASFLGLLFLSPVFLLIAIAMHRDSPGPIFYGGPRLGRGGNEFKILKFRTMYECPESYAGLPLTADGDERITPLGKWLRDTKINELPQLWNVFTGQMSLVGPRPEDPNIAATWPEETRKIILSVRPGITSPASVIYRNEEKQLTSTNVMDEYLSRILPDKLRLDELYVRDQNFFTDLDVIFMTLIMLLPRVRRNEVSEPLLFAGPFYRFVRRTFSWFLIDSVIAFIAIAICGGIWRLSYPLNLGFGRALGVAVIISLLFSITNSFLGLKKVVWRTASPLYALDLGFSALLTLLIVWLANSYILKEALLPARLIWDFGILTYFGFLVIRYRERLITGMASRWVSARRMNSVVGERVLIIGAGECGELAIWLMKKSHYANAFSIVGFADDDFRKQDYTIHDYPILGTTRDIPTIVKNRNIGLILFAISRCTRKEQERILATCKATSARLVIIPDFIDIFKRSLQKQADEVSG